MGEIQNQPFQLSFNALLKVDFRGSRVTSDGGLILVRELDERPDLGELIEEDLADSRHGKNTQFRSPICCGNPSPVAWGATKTSMMPEALPGPHVPTDRLGEDLGARRSANLPLAEF